MGLLNERCKPSFGPFESVVLAAYALLSAVLTWKHEPWADEAQSWLIARDSSLPDLFLKRLHYEGTPGLWHLLLWILSRLHVSFAGMHWFTAALGLAAVYLLLRYSPFPKLVRAIIPFGFALVFQTAIIARSYSLLPLLVFALCIIITGRRDRPIAVAVLAGLLANVSAHAVFLAAALVLVYLWRRPASPRQSLLAPAAILAAFFVLAIYTSIPTPDVSYGIGPKLAANPKIAHILSRITGVPVPSPAITNELPVPPTNATPDTKAWAAPFTTHMHWLTRIPRKSLPGKLVVAAYNLLSLAFFTLSTSNLLALAFSVALLLWLAKHRALPAILPWAFVLLFGYLLGMGEHHASIAFVALIAVLWCAWNHTAPTRPHRLDLAFQILLLAVLLEQAAWTAHAAIYDIRQPFDGGLAASRFLEAQHPRRTIGTLDFNAVSIEPWFPHNIFSNQPTAYFPWRLHRNPVDGIAETVAARTPILIDSESGTGDVVPANQIFPSIPTWTQDDDPRRTYLLSHAYIETHRFCGLQPARFGFSQAICQVIYQPLAPTR